VTSEGWYFLKIIWICY